MTTDVKSLLTELENELKRLNRWQTIAPDAEKFDSTLPFSVDTLSLYEWLQWVFIARLTALLEAGSALPKSTQVLPYAEEVTKKEPFNASTLLSIIDRLDKQMA